jgi:DNA mismatch repair protein MutL
VPSGLSDIATSELLTEILNDLTDDVKSALKPEIILDKIASRSCKAAVKGNSRLSEKEAEHLISQLLELDNPYHCPHGRPTIIRISKKELEKKFKRIV